MSEGKARIRVKAVCLLGHRGRFLMMDGRTLVATGKRPVQAGAFYRMLGGTIDFYEKAEECARREIREELQSELSNVRLLEVAENLYEYAGEKNHEIMFVFGADLENTALYEKESIRIEEDGYTFDAVWVPKEELLREGARVSPAINRDHYLA